MIIIGLPLSFNCFTRHVPCMELQDVLEGIMGPKMWRLLHGLIVTVGEVLTFGARKECLIVSPLFSQTPHRSTHNTRIERLWFDFTRGMGRKWKDFFIDLEENHGFLVGSPSHVWLLHWLFLDAVNEEVQEWVEAWNHHRISLRGTVDRSPRDLFLFSIVQDGMRGMVSNPEIYDEPIQGNLTDDDPIQGNLMMHRVSR
jgi:hypothetical protein